MLSKKDNKESVSIFGLLVLILLCAGLWGIYHYYPEFNTSKKTGGTPEQVASEKVLLALGKLMDLPIDETPSIATILDKEKLKNEPFFKNSENGDVIFVYNKAAKAILYRPSLNKIMQVEPVFFKDTATTTPQVEGTTTPEKIKVAYYNGTTISGLSGETEKKVQGKYPTYEAGAVTNATNRDYAETLVIDLLGKHAKEAEDLAVFLGGKVSDLPSGEIRPEADMLVILGK